MIKIMPLQGLKLSHSITTPLKIKHILNESHEYYDEIKLWTYEDYLTLKKENRLDHFIDLDKIKQFDLLISYETQSHNTAEVMNLKILIPALYFAMRLAEEKLRSDNLINIEGMNEHEFFENYHLEGFFGKDYIISDRWYVTLGNQKVTRDDFDQFIVRAFSDKILDEYERQSKFEPTVTEIKVNEDFMDKLKRVINKINKEDDYSKRLRSAFKIYYNVLSEANIDNSIVSYAIILESLLSKKNENNKARRISYRSACLVANNQTQERKYFIANAVYKLYAYRNKIVHDGVNFLQLDDESTLRATLKIIRHTIYSIIKNIIEHDIKTISEIEKIVEDNMNEDDISDSFQYVTIELQKDPIDIIYMGE